MIFNDYYNKSFLDHKSWLVSIRKSCSSFFCKRRKSKALQLVKKPSEVGLRKMLAENEKFPWETMGFYA